MFWQFWRQFLDPPLCATIAASCFRHSGSSESCARSHSSSKQKKTRLRQVLSTACVGWNIACRDDDPPSPAVSQPRDERPGPHLGQRGGFGSD